MFTVSHQTVRILMKLTLVFLTLLTLLTPVVRSEVEETKDEGCAYCQLVMSSVHGWFNGKNPSQRQIINKATGTCKRYPKYKRRCLLTIGTYKSDWLSEVVKTPFNVREACKTLKECETVGDYEVIIVEDFLY